MFKRFLASLKILYGDTNYKFLSNTTAITQNQFYVFVLDDIFKPYNDVIVFNASTTSDAQIFVNENIQIPLLKGTSVHLQTETYEVRVQNLSVTSLSINDIKVNYRRLTGNILWKLSR